MSNEFIYLNNLEKENRMFRKEIQELHINIETIENNLKDCKSRIEQATNQIEDFKKLTQFAFDKLEYSDDLYKEMLKSEITIYNLILIILKGEKHD